MTIDENQDDDSYDADTDEPVSHEQPRTKRRQSNKGVDRVLKQTHKGYEGVNMSNIKELQRSDDILMNIVAYLERNILPESQKDSRRILLESSDFILVEKFYIIVENEEHEPISVSYTKTTYSTNSESCASFAIRWTQWNPKHIRLCKGAMLFRTDGNNNK